MRSNLRRRAARLVALGLALATLGGCAKRPESKIDVEVARTYAWSDEARDAFGAIPVQDAGRVKPMSTFAGFSLLALNGKRKYELPEESLLPTAGEELDPVAWLLDVLFFPEQAVHYEVFLVDDAAVLEGVGLRFENRKRRDRYSYMQLATARSKIVAAAQAAHRKPETSRSTVDRQSLELYERIADFESLLGTLDFARLTVPLDAPPELLAAFGDRLFAKREQTASLSATAFLTEAEVLAPIFERLRNDDRGTAEGLAEFESSVAASLDRLAESMAHSLHLFAPPEGDEWESAGEALAASMDRRASRDDVGLAAAREKGLAALADAYRLRTDEAAMLANLQAARDATVTLAEARGAYSKVPMERAFYRMNFFYNALAVFILGFVLAALSWLVPGSAWLKRGVWVMAALGCALVITGVGYRCVLRGRPPISTLYETILFITGTAVLTCLVLHRLLRLPLAATVATFVGAVGMFMANRYEMRDAITSGDTMTALMAVLDTNFWLATHVTTVTLGYSAGLLASILAHVWLGARIAGFRAGDSRWYRQLGRAVYGIVAFGLLFSVVGTILGGIWANDSWGRFWGWDPKENGALMICLFELGIVHARLGGYVKDFGVCVLAVVLGPVVAFSWWHVNLLGVGLHSYGFTQGIKEKLVAYYALEAAVAAVALLWWGLIGRRTLRRGRLDPPASAA